MPAVGAAISALVTAFTTSAIGTFLTTTFIGRLLTSVALSALSNALKKKPPAPGIRSQATISGGDNPQGFILGRYATGGQLMAPPLTHGKVGKTPNAYLTYVIALGDIPGQTLASVILNDEYVALTGPIDGNYGTSIGGRYLSYAWVKYYDGTQTAADPMMLAKYGGHPQYPWQADMIGRGICYAIVTFRYKREIFNGLPKVRFVMDGIPLYDPRKDSSVGGSGAHRWVDQTTWSQTRNPMVMAYNIHRGITLPDGSIWGGRSAAADLPLSSWFAAMNACDATVTTSSGTETAYRAGYEVYVADEPASVEEELLKACSANVSELGGIWKTRVGPPASPIYSFTDDDVLFSEDRHLSLFPGLDQTFNGIHCSYPEPASLWETKDAPPRYNGGWETTDLGRRLIADLQMPACPYSGQVQRLMQSYISEERRFRRHVVVLPPDAAILEPLDSVAWTSAENGYTNKVFEVVEVSDKLMTGCQVISLRERDASDYDWSPAMELPTEPVASVPTVPPPLDVPSFAVVGHAINDAGGNPRRPALRLSWDPTDIDGVDGIQYEVRLAATGAVVARNWIRDFEAGWLLVADGILAGVDYEAKAQFSSRTVETVWTGWEAATAPNIGLTDMDFQDGIYQLFLSQGLYAIRDVPDLLTPGLIIGEKVYLRSNGGLYEWDGTNWVVAIGKVKPGSIGTPEIVANSITGGLVAASGIITNSAQINDGLISRAKIQNLAVDTLQINDGAVTKQATMFTAGGISIPNNNSYVKVGELFITVGTAPVLIIFQFNITNYSAGVMFAPRRNGVRLTSQVTWDYYMFNPYVGVGQEPIYVATDFPGAGTHHYEFFARCDTSMSANTVSNRTGFALTALK